MSIDAEKLTVVHNVPHTRFEIEAEGLLAILEYRMRGNRMIFNHTGVPRPLEAQGLGSRLAKAGLDYARENSHQVVPACEFMEVYIRRHPEYKDLVSAQGAPVEIPAVAGRQPYRGVGAASPEKETRPATSAFCIWRGGQDSNLRLRISPQ